ncbi:YbfB/YjiJ family MFS transporter [Mesorhizobium sp. CAU 1732]|uniref:YbfB/YjiJ family MFS transporter n=1 Tax=Mesorhizobium sp. CAU 1732 TaxID=3140358 RepID=UPI0032613DDA
MDSSARSPATYAIAGMIAMAVAMGIGRFVYTPILPGMMDALGLTASDAGLIASANYAGYLVGAVLGAGNWGQGREHTIAMVSLASSAVLAAAMGMTESMPAFIAIRFLAGVASAFVMVFLSTIIFSRLAAAGRSDLQVWHFGGVGIGIALSSVMTGAVLLGGAQWEANWLWSGALSIAGFAVVFALVDRGVPPQTRPAAEPPTPRSTAMTRIILAYGIFGFGYIVTATFLVTIVRQGDAGPLFESVVWLATGLAALPSVWLWSRVSRRIGLAQTFAVGCLVEAVGVIASVSMGGYAGPLLAGVLLGGTFVAVTAFGLTIGRELAGAAPRRVLALMTAAFGLGQIIGPVVGGIVADQTGSFTAPSLLAAAALIASAVAIWGVRSKV